MRKNDREGGEAGRSIQFFYKRTFYIFIFLGMMAFFGYYIFFLKESPQESMDGEVQGSLVKREDIRVSVSGSGQIYADNQVTLNSVIAGEASEVINVYVENDQRVKKGDSIIALDSAEAQKSVRDAELSLWNAQIKMRQIEKQYTTQTEEDRMNRQLQEISLIQARNKLSDAKEELERYLVVAPFDGILTGLSLTSGDSISREDTIASIISDSFYAKISLNEIDAVNVKEGNEAILTFSALGNEKYVQGRVNKVDTIGSITQNVVSYNIEITFENDANYDLKPGMSVSAEIILSQKENTLVVPVSAVKEDTNGKSFVLISSITDISMPMDRRNFEKVFVERGIANDIDIEIVQGVKEGQIVMINESSPSRTEEGRGSLSTGSIFSVPGSGSGMREGRSSGM